MSRLARLPAAAALAASLYPIAHLALATPAQQALAMGGSVVLVAVAAAVAALLVRFVGAAPVLLALGIGWCALALLAGGSTALLGFALYAAAALALGAPLVRGLDGVGALERALVAYLTGAALMVALLSLLLPLPVHSPPAYAALALAACAWRWRDLGELLGEVVRQGRSAWAARPARTTGTLAVLTLLMGLLGAAGALTPIASYDDVAYHLRMPYELLRHQRYAFDVSLHVWAAAPWAADLAFAIPFVISGGNEGVKAWVAGSYHLAGAVLLLGLLLRRVPVLPALALLFGYLAIPLLVAANHTLHTEGVGAALVLAVFALWARQRHAAAPRAAIVAALLLGLLGALKATNLVTCLFLGLLWLPAFWRQAKARPAVGLLLSTALATAAIPYATSWIRTGNPVLPLFNAVFRSPYFDAVNFTNPVFSGMFGPGLFASLFLDGPRHLETGLATAGGLVVFLLVPPTLLVLAARGDRERRAALAVALAHSLVLLASQQYLRYLLPVMGLAVFAASCLWDEAPLAEGRAVRWWRGWWAVLLLLGASATTLTMHKVHWQTSLSATLRSLDPARRDGYLAQYAPARLLAPAADRELGAQARVLYLGDPVGAALEGKAIYPNWYNRRAQKDFDAVVDTASAAAFVQAHGVTHVVVHTAGDLPPPARVMEAYARGHGRVAAVARTAELLALRDDVVWRRTLWQAPAGTPLASDAVLLAAAPAEGEGAVLLEVAGDCDSAASRPAFDVWWDRKGQRLRADSVVASCTVLEGRAQPAFEMRWQLNAPAGADTLQVRLAGLNAEKATARVARVRGLARPAAGPPM